MLALFLYELQGFNSYTWSSQHTSANILQYGKQVSFGLNVMFHRLLIFCHKDLFNCFTYVQFVTKDTSNMLVDNRQLDIREFTNFKRHSKVS